MPRKLLAALFVTILAGSHAHASIAITEWMYAGNNDEFIELTNVSSTAVDLTGWFYDDNNRGDTQISLSSLGIVAPGESVILAESSESKFREAWGVASTVKILAKYPNNLGRNDEINIYNAQNTLVDRLTYGDQDIPGSIRTQAVSGNIPVAALGQNDVMQAVLSAANDSYGSWTSAGGDIGNPGVYIPEPASLALLTLGAALLRRKRVR